MPADTQLMNFVPSGDFRYLGANAITARYIQEHQPPFLRRNLEAALDHHEKRLRSHRELNNRLGLSSSTSTALTNPTPGNRLDRALWQPPAGPILARWIEMNPPRLRINFKGLQPRRSGRDTPTDSQEPANSTRKRRKVIDCRCRIDITIFELAEYSNGITKRVENKPRQAITEDVRLQGRKFDDGKHYFDIVQDKVIQFHLNQLEVDDPRISDPSLAGLYEIEFALKILGRDDANEVVQIMGGHVPDTGPMYPLIARYGGLPKCLQPNKFLRVGQFINGNKAKTKYILDLDMSWSNEHGKLITRDSTLTALNKLQRKAAASLPTPLSTPTPSVNTPEATPRELEYVFAGFRSERVQGLRCIICRNREYTTLDRLRLHFDTTHCNHQETFLIKEEGSTVKIIVEQEARGRGSRRKQPLTPESWPPEHEEGWVAPKKPFNVEEAVRGDLGWEESGSFIKKSPVAVEAAPSGPGPRALEDITLNLPLRQKRRFFVPDNPPDNRRYFSSSTKRVLEPGELLSESDDEIKMDRPKEAPNIWRNEMDAVQEFYKSINRHLKREKISAHLHFGDTVLRWLQLPESWRLLVIPSVASAFENLLASRKDLISEDVFTYSLLVMKCASQKIDSHLVFPGLQWIQEFKELLKQRNVDGLLMWMQLNKADLKERMSKFERDGEKVLQKVDLHRTTGSGAYQSRNLKLGEEEQGMVAGAERSDSHSSPLDPNPSETTTSDSEDVTEQARQVGDCLCGKQVQNLADCVTCSNDECKFPDHHLACVELKRFEDDWLCSACKFSASSGNES